jgi:hypothetical protein
MIIVPKSARIPGVRPKPEPKKVRLVKLMAPLPFATTFDPTCSSVTVYAWTGRRKKGDAVTRNISERRIAAKISVFIVISGLAPMKEITAGPGSPLGKPSSPHTSRSDGS